jgi:hypothetical protein
VDGGTASQCNNGCCDSAGYCVAGTLTSSCGRGLPECFSCGGLNGNACLDGGSCGCLTELNCSPAYTCANEVCTKACDGSVSSLCHDGCCSAMGQCSLGQASSACGRAVSGGTCADCTSSCSPGPACNPVPDGGGAYACSCRDNGGCSGAAACSNRKVCVGAEFAFDGGPITQLGTCQP